jgi:hypothetical protein
VITGGAGGADLIVAEHDLSDEAPRKFGVQDR